MMETFTVNLPRDSSRDGGRMLDDKEQVAFFEVVALHKGEFATPVTARVWMGHRRTASVVHASIWVRTREGRSISGYGSVRGYGYDKISAAILAAVRGAGIEASHVDSGGLAVRETLTAIARAAGYRKVHLVQG